MRRSIDIGRFVAYYLQVLACFSILSIVAGVIFWNSLHFDASFIFLFCAAHHLKRHNQTARKWTLWLSGLMLACLVLGVIFAAAVGTENMTVTIGRPFEHPTYLQVIAVTSVLGLMAGIPFALLLTRQAKREFDIRPVEETVA